MVISLFRILSVALVVPSLILASGESSDDVVKKPTETVGERHNREIKMKNVKRFVNGSAVLAGAFTLYKSDDKLNDVKKFTQAFLALAATRTAYNVASDVRSGRRFDFGNVKHNFKKACDSSTLSAAALGCAVCQTGLPLAVWVNAKGMMNSVLPRKK